MSARALVLALAVSVAAPAALAADGKALFRTKCGICHLQGGTGTFMLSRRLGASQALLEERQDLDRALVLHVARNGLQSMPRFSRAELPDSELQAIADYLTRKDAAVSK
jgi:mono/diheme cytochrome c family protein